MNTLHTIWRLEFKMLKSNDRNTQDALWQKIIKLKKRYKRDGGGFYNPPSKT